MHLHLLDDGLFAKWYEAQAKLWVLQELIQASYTGAGSSLLNNHMYYLWYLHIACIKEKLQILIKQLGQNYPK